MKTKNVLNFQKIFLNICRTDIIPKPVEITESELASILESDEPSTFRIPMSLGEAHEEVDKCRSSQIILTRTIHQMILYFQLAIHVLCMTLQSIKSSSQLWKEAYSSRRFL